MRKSKILKAIIFSAVVVVASFTVSSLMTGCAATDGGAGSASVVGAAAAAKAKADSIAAEKYERVFLIAISDGNEHYKNKNYADAVQPYQKAAKMDTTHKYPAIYTKLADSFLKLDKPDSALAVYQEALNIYPENAFFHRSTGYYLAALQRTTEAIDCYYNAIKYDGETVSDYKNLGPLLIKEDRLEDALIIYQKLVELDPNDAEAQEIIAILLHKLDYDVLDIIAQKKKALEANPKDAELIFEIAELLFKEQFYAESVDYFDKFLAVSPDNTSALEYKGNALQNDEKFPDAIKSYEKLLALQPDNVKIICEMAACYIELGNLNKALTLSQQAINKNSNFGLGYIVKGDVYARAADFCIDKREKRIVNFDDKLVYEKAYNLYELGASQDIQYSDRGKRKMNNIKIDLPTKEDRFMHPDQTKPELECYEWLPW
ncbi:tetratricopeptide repeat protein [candidate division KSB1 bacterium]|nr:tetratricopeptide repeat protein [candidate division KSB1 bacterium]